MPIKFFKLIWRCNFCDMDTSWPSKRLFGQLRRDHSVSLMAGQNGTIDGQGKMWWELWWNRTLEHTRGHLLELVNSDNILVSNLTFRNSPFWTVHPVYCRSDLPPFVCFSNAYSKCVLERSNHAHDTTLQCTIKS